MSFLVEPGQGLDLSAICHKEQHVLVLDEVRLVEYNQESLVVRLDAGVGGVFVIARSTGMNPSPLATVTASWVWVQSID